MDLGQDQWCVLFGQSMSKVHTLDEDQKYTL